MEIKEYYAQYVLRPIENNIKEIYKLYYSKNILNIIMRCKYKKVIDNYNKLYLEKLKQFDKIISEELNDNLD